MMPTTPHSPRFDAEFRARLDELLKWRRDVRHFRSDPLPPGLLETLLESTRYAPSVGLSEPWRFVTVDDPERRRRVQENFERCNQLALTSQSDERAALYARLKLAGLIEAPVHLAVYVEPAPEQGHGLGRSTMPETIAFSAAMAIYGLWLTARAADIGLGWVSIIEPTAINLILDVPRDWQLIGYLCLGYPQQDHDIPELERTGWEHRAAAPIILPR